MGAIGLAVGFGATISNEVAGAIANYGGVRLAFLALATAGIMATALVWILVPKTVNDQPVTPTRPSAPRERETAVL